MLGAVCLGSLLTSRPGTATDQPQGRPYGYAEKDNHSDGIDPSPVHDPEDDRDRRQDPADHQRRHGAAPLAAQSRVQRQGPGNVENHDLGHRWKPLPLPMRGFSLTPPLKARVHRTRTAGTGRESSLQRWITRQPDARVPCRQRQGSVARRLTGGPLMPLSAR
jgi:hypothetical protein